jgi:hypothetical protein
MSEITSFPLCWPQGWERTPRNRVDSSRFRTSVSWSIKDLLNEIRLLGGMYPVISSNVPTKRDGTPYANFREPGDSGVSVYFNLKGKQQCIPCDNWNKVVDNIVAISKTINALRGIDRWGTKKMRDATFKGFKALPPSNDRYFYNCYNESDLKLKYKRLVKELHPDLGGTQESFIEMKEEFEFKKKKFNGVEDNG